MILNMFRASLCSSSGGQLYIYSIWYRPTLYTAIQCTNQERTALQSALDPYTNHFNVNLDSISSTPKIETPCSSTSLDVIL
jgi:hypothetical protein